MIICFCFIDVGLTANKPKHNPLIEKVQKRAKIKALFCFGEKAMNLCMKYKCKVCPKEQECSEKLKHERLMYRPFENLKEILEAKYGTNNPLLLDAETEQKAH